VVLARGLRRPRGAAEERKDAPLRGLGGAEHEEDDDRQADASAMRASGEKCVEDPISGGRIDPLSLVLFDLDHFKQVNDRYGHQVGDAVLVEMVERVTRTIRVSDSLTRWGGEEFVVLAPLTGLTSEKDLPVLASALLGKADVLVTGVKRDLLIIRKHDLPFAILSPAEFLDDYLPEWLKKL